MTKRYSIEDVKLSCEKLNWDLIDVEYKNSHQNILCKCKKCNYEWEATPTSLLRAKIGCPKCVNKNTGNRCRKLKKEFVRELYKVNKNINVLGEYINYGTDILCECNIHHIKFYSKPVHLLRGHSKCSKCSSHISHGEQQLCKILDDWNITYETQKRFDDCRDIFPLPFDVYLHDYDIVIEYDGEGHYTQINRSKDMEQNKMKFDDCKKHDKMKNEYCKKNKIPLIRIPYWEKDDMESFLFDKFVELGVITPMTS